MNRTFTRALACSLVAVTAFSALPANAGERWRHSGYKSHHQRPVIVKKSNNSGDLLAAGILGLAAGAIVAGIATQPRPVYNEPLYGEPLYRDPPHFPRPSPEREYFPPAPDYRQPHPATVKAGFEPWTRAWYDYCADRYRSFDPDTGTFMGYDGIRRFCVAN